MGLWAAACCCQGDLLLASFLLSCCSWNFCGAGNMLIGLLHSIAAQDGEVAAAKTAKVPHVG